MQVKQTVRKKARIEIIPLIDVIMFLMAAFVLVMLSMNKNKQVPVELPSATPSPALIQDQPEKPVKVSIDTAGDYFWNSERVSLDDLIIRLNGLKAQSADPKVMIEGEIGAQFGKAVVVVDEARHAGINKVTFDPMAKNSVR
ncbi:MAG TPA: biopolymer transporter ExbD [Opitutaceae bacterium]|nr:biopolymer transporter ExbD [Opitutaceae bacterium]